MTVSGSGNRWHTKNHTGSISRRDDSQSWAQGHCEGSTAPTEVTLDVYHPGWEGGGERLAGPGGKKPRARPPSLRGTATQRLRPWESQEPAAPAPSHLGASAARPWGQRAGVRFGESVGRHTSSGQGCNAVFGVLFKTWPGEGKSYRLMRFSQTRTKALTSLWQEKARALRSPFSLPCASPGEEQFLRHLNCLKSRERFGDILVTSLLFSE